MATHHRTLTLFAAIACGALAACSGSDKPAAAPAAANAPGAPSAGVSDDAAEVLHYRLTGQNVERFLLARRRLRAIASDTLLAARADSPGPDSSDARTLDAMAARLERMPGAKQALEGAGLSAREYVVGSLAITAAAMACEMQKQGLVKQLPATVNADNVRFFAVHPDLLHRMQAAPDSGDTGR